ncbi:spindle assembly checkpoint component Mad1p [[Candida] anglica]
MTWGNTDPTTSSPFVEHPSSQRFHDEQDDTKQTVSKLQFQLSSAHTERKLLMESKNELINKYDALLQGKNEELEVLKSNFDYLYSQRDSWKSKLENADQIQIKSDESYQKQLTQQNKELSKLRTLNIDLTSRCNKSQRESEQIRNTVDYLQEENNSLNERLDDLVEQNSELLNQNNQLVQQVNDNIVKSKHTMSSVAQMENLKGKIESLQKTNNTLQSKLDSLLQHKTSVELLKQKNISYQQKINSFAAVEEKCCKLEIENLELKAKLKDFFDIIEGYTETDTRESAQSKINQFIDQFKQIQNTNLILNDKYNEAHQELNLMKDQVSKLEEEKVNELLPKITSLTQVLQSRQELIDKFQKQKLLNVKEIEFLRESLKSMDNLSIKKDTDVNSKEEYVVKLEKLVDEYRNERDAALKKQEEYKQEPKLGDKRQCLHQERDVDITKLEKQNFEILASNKELNDKLKTLELKLKTLEELKEKREQLKVLQLRSNYVSRDQVVKQQTLDVLRKENEELLKPLVANENSVPKAVFERQENDKAILQTKVDQLSKRINRLREVYSKKSCEILSIISKFFGYSVEFLPSPINPEDLSSSRIKLISKYSSKEGDNSYLVIDVHTKSLKAHGTGDFKDLCEDLVTNWVKDKDQIPCFLSALNMSLFERSQSILQ